MSVTVRSRKLKSGKTQFYLDIYHKGTRKREYLKEFSTSSKQEEKLFRKAVDELRAKREYELLVDSKDLVNDHSQNRDFVAYFDTIAGVSHRTWKTVAIHLKKYLKNGKLPFKQVDREWVEGFRAYLLARVEQNAASIYFSKIKAALNRALKEGIITRNPGQHVSGIPKKDTQIQFLTTAELMKLLDAPCRDAEVRRAFLFSCYTGLRMSDVKTLTGAMIRGDSIAIRQKKTETYNYLPLGVTAVALLGPRLDDPHEPVFKLRSEVYIWDILQEWSKAAQLTKHVSFHVARHTFATQLHTYGADLYSISKLMGHTDLKHTQRYARVVDSRKREVVGLLPELSLENGILKG